MDVQTKVQTINYSNGTRYEGEVKNNIPNGKGKIIYSDGDAYEGNFKNGKLNGKGKAIYNNGGVYKGDFVDGIPNGKGKFRSSANKIYEGEFLNSKFHGKGVLRFPNGTTIEGQFFNGVIKIGEIKYHDGTKYKGAILNLKPNGEGELVYSNGNKYKGEFLDGNIKPGTKGTFSSIALNTLKVSYEPNSYKVNKIDGDFNRLKVSKISSNPKKEIKNLLLFNTRFGDNGCVDIVNHESTELANNLQKRISKTKFKNKISFEHASDFENITCLNNKKIRFISVTTTEHQFNLMIDEKAKKATILDNGGLKLSNNQMEQMQNHLQKNLGLKCVYKVINFKDSNNLIGCVNESQAMLEKLCRWFEKGNMYKEGSNKRVEPTGLDKLMNSNIISEKLYKALKPFDRETQTTAILRNIAGDDISEKLGKIKISVASNIHKMQDGVGSGYSVKITDPKANSITFSNKTQVNNKSIDKSTNIASNHR